MQCPTDRDHNSLALSTLFPGVDWFYASTEGYVARVIVGMTWQDCDKIPDDSYNFRIDLLRSQIQQAFGGFNDPQAIYMFLAPEYLFRKNRNPSSEMDAGRPDRDPYSFYTELDRNTILVNMQALSRMKPKLLLIPGSIFWAAGAAQITSPDSLAMRPIRNSAPVIYRGQLIGWYDKHKDFSELTKQENAGRHFFMHGKRHGLFMVESLRCGMEICGDHSTSELLKDKVSGLDLQIIVANSTTFSPASAATKTNGYVLLCSASRNRANGFWSLRVFKAGRQYSAPAKFDVAKAHAGAINAALTKFKEAAKNVIDPEPQDVPVTATPTPYVKVWDLAV